MKHITLDEYIRTEEFQTAENQEFYSNDSLINLDAKTTERIREHAETGGDGRTHSEVITFWRDSLGFLADELGLSEDNIYTLEAEIDNCELWHENNGDLFDVIG